MLKGQAKKDYQREYMKGYMKLRRAKGILLRPSSVSPVKTSIPCIPVPELDADGQPIYEA